MITIWTQINTGKFRFFVVSLLRMINGVILSEAKNLV